MRYRDGVSFEREGLLGSLAKVKGSLERNVTTVKCKDGVVPGHS